PLAVSPSIKSLARRDSRVPRISRVRSWPIRGTGRATTAAGSGWPVCGHLRSCPPQSADAFRSPVIRRPDARTCTGWATTYIEVAPDVQDRDATPTDQLHTNALLDSWPPRKVRHPLGSPTRSGTEEAGTPQGPDQTKAVAVEARREKRCVEAHGWWEQRFWRSYSFHPLGLPSKKATSCANHPNILTTRIRMAFSRATWNRSWTGSGEKFASSSVKPSQRCAHCRP